MHATLFTASNTGTSSSSRCSLGSCVYDTCNLNDNLVVGWFVSADVAVLVGVARLLGAVVPRRRYFRCWNCSINTVACVRACVRAWRPMIMSLADEHLSAPRVPRPSHTRPPTTTNQCSALSDSLRHNAYTHTHTIAVRPSHWVGRRRYDPSPRTRPHYVYGFRPFIRLPLISPSGAVNKCKSNCNKSSARRPPVTDVTSKGKLPGTVSNIY